MHDDLNNKHTPEDNENASGRRKWLQNENYLQLNNYQRQRIGIIASVTQPQRDSAVNCGFNVTANVFMLKKLTNNATR
jgi:hypothetical protein